MNRAVFVLLLLLFASPAYSQREDGCTYHTYTPGTVEGEAPFIAIWQKGCNTITFYQHAQPSSVHFGRSPCAAYNLEIWISPNTPPGAESTGYTKKSEYGDGFS